MEAALREQINSHLDILPRATKKAFIFLSKQALIGKSDRYLAGGTALALQAGHRKSVDLDFFDLYWCAKNIEPMENLIKRLKAQYPTVAHDYHHILKSLVYFNDAESDPMPEVYFKISWKDVKDYFKKEILNITNKIIIKK